MADEKAFQVRVEKLDSKHGTLIGWAMLCKTEGKRYVDRDGDFFDEDDLYSAFVGFSEKSTLGVMHEQADTGKILSLLPLTTEVQKALGLQSDKSGLAIICKPSEEVYK